MLLFNLDCTDFCYHHDTREDGGGQVDRYVDRILDGGVTHLLCNTQTERTNYASAAWEPFWTGYDPDGPDEQPFLCALRNAESAKRWRRLVDGMLNLHLNGVDYPARVIERCRARGACAWISLRMNDVHCQDNEAHPIHSDFWRGTPGLRRLGYSGYYAKALDYAHDAVREHYLALVKETLDRYDIDGLELDFMREPYLFSQGQEAAGRHILTQWLRTIRALVEGAAKARGHAIELGVRVPSRPEVADRFGLDAATWAREGLIDLLVPTPRWASIEFDIPIPRWHRMLTGTVTRLAGGLEVGYCPFRGATRHGVTPGQARGAAAQILGDGADGVYLFNYFPSGQASGERRWWTPDEYPRILRSLASLQDLRRLPRTHAVSGHDVSSPDGVESADDQLPAKGAQVELTLPTGPKPDSGWTATVTLDVEMPARGQAPAPLLHVNGGPGLAPRHSRAIGAEQGDYPVPAGYLHHVYELPVDALADRAVNRFELRSRGSQPIRVLALRVDLGGLVASESPGAPTSNPPADEWIRPVRDLSGHQ